MARYDHLPIWKDAVALTALLEEVVRHLDANHPWFARYAQPPVAQIRSGRICPRYHKYALGADLRRQAYAVCRGVVVANGERDGRLAAVERLVLAVEELKLLIQMGKEVRAFASFREFERAAELAVALSKQSGGWRRALAEGAGASKRPEGAPRGAAP